PLAQATRLVAVRGALMLKPEFCSLEHRLPARAVLTARYDHLLEETAESLGKQAALHKCVSFFQAEGGIRAPLVTGVQTCALPICWSGSARKGGRPEIRRYGARRGRG